MPHLLAFRADYAYKTTSLGITVPVRLQRGEASIEIEAKIDTGAGCCIFARIHGEGLGLQIESGIRQEISTATGTFTTYGHRVTLFVLGIECEATAWFAADYSFNRDVLGREGWLDRVRLGLVDYEGKLYLSDYNDA